MYVGHDCISWQVCILDPNQGGSEITEELMAGVGCLMTTSDPPQVGAKCCDVLGWRLYIYVVTSFYIDKGGKVHRNHDTDHMLQWFVLFSWLQLLTRDENPVPTTDELLELLEPEDGITQLDEWVELQVDDETSPLVVDVHQDLDILAGPSSVTVASDERQEQVPLSLISASASSPHPAEESNNVTEVIKGDTEVVSCSSSVPLSQQTPVTVEKSQFITHAKPPVEEEKMLEVKMLEKEKRVDSTKVELSVGTVAPTFQNEEIDEETKVSQPSDPEPESDKEKTQDVTRTPAIRPEQSPTLGEEAEPNLGLDLLQDSEKIAKGGDLSGTTASVECAQLLQESIAAEATTAAQKDTEDGNDETNQDACSSSRALRPVEEPTTAQGTL